MPSYKGIQARHVSSHKQGQHMVILKQSVSKKTLESLAIKGCQPLDIRHKNMLKKFQKKNV